MSNNNLSVPPTYADYSSEVSAAAAHLTSLRRQLPLLGTRRDSPTVRNQLQEVIKDCDQCLIRAKHFQSEAVGSSLKGKTLLGVTDSTKGTAADDKIHKFEWERAKKEIHTLSDELTRIKSVVHSYPPPTDPLKEQKEKQLELELQTELSQQLHISKSSGNKLPHTETTPLLAEQQQEQLQVQKDQLNQSALNFQTAQILDRDDDIQAIERGVNDINAIFRDLGSLISQQGTQVDTIEENANNTTKSIQRGQEQLLKSNNRLKSRGKCTFILLMVLLIFIVIFSILML
ncbi:hypothetical protein NADFUDRAFT_70968 [Nadsonia fulvescens var. elongata DSM 6958]|uniref:t-SNARE coiled-coil homology domain-containing protein n=1 Tax=Nadsonia fulvescens var. elongata DSM 6958 TaxID=857566 RepID=A0A1E3PHQ9_9ASCO|nr:hypothetical protein NADFUDRAFT_70968 [Nadsonia fulvescens var. elongata DSM 6958]